MSAAAISLVLAAALAHASWNLFSKQAAATGAVAFIWLVAVGAAIAYAPVAVGTAVLGHPSLTWRNWAFLALTGALHTGYFLFLQSGYRLGDLSLTYPVGRGTGALLAAVAGIVLLGERPAPVQAAGIAAVIAGVVVIGWPTAGTRAAFSPGALAFAVTTGVFIACYTVCDKYAVSTLHTPPAIQGYPGYPVMAVAFAPFALGRRDLVARVWQRFRPQVIGAALLSPLAYLLVLTALSFTAVSAVAPAREVSVVFAILLGRRMLGEAGLARRLAAGAAIAAGIIAIALG